MTILYKRCGIALLRGIALFLWASSAVAQVDHPASLRAIPGDSEQSHVAAQSIANNSSSVTELRANVVRTFGRKPAENLIFGEALVDFDPRYKENLVAGLKIGIVPLNAPGAYRPYVWGGGQTRDYPYVVAVIGSREICTGVVLNGNSVLTAAHCFCNNKIQQIHTGGAVFRGTSVAVVGEPKSLDTLECENGKFGRDIGLIYLPLSANLPSAKLAMQRDIAMILTRQPNMLRLVGYGLTKDGGLGTKNFVDLPVASSNCTGSVPLSTASVADGDYYGCLPNQELVAGEVALDHDACGGDSGAPLILEEGADATVIAISSRNVARRRTCGDGGIYALCDGQVLAFVRNAQSLRP